MGVMRGVVSVFVSGVVGLVSVTAQDVEWRTLDVGGTTLRYAVALPDDYDPTQPHPLLLAFPAGDQGEAMVLAGLSRTFGLSRGTASPRGFVVVSPQASPGTTFHDRSARLVAPLLTELRKRFRIAGGRIHLAGAANGGRSAFHAAVQRPFEFQSLTVFPGEPPTDEDRRLLSRLRRVRVRAFVLGDDDPWLQSSRATQESLRALDVDAELTVLSAEGHEPPSLDGPRIMETIAALDAARGGAQDGAAAEVASALDAFHDAATMADEDAYFGAFAPDAVFLGTDPAERWTVDAFKSFALPYFKERDSAWIYVPQSRHVTVDPGGQVAWFDEELGNASYGLCRGTGALRRIDGRWKITLYDLTVPVPNDLMGAVVRRIKAREDGRSAVTTVWVVRHAEKTVEDDDPPLSVAGIARAQDLARVLGTAGIDAIYTSEYTRTKDTAAPLATRLGITPTVVTARDVVGLARTIANRGGTVLVVGHSNTVPAILRSLGATEPIAITEDTYDDLFQLTLAPEGPTLHHLHYGPGS